jgi:hypothetical protein
MVFTASTNIATISVTTKLLTFIQVQCTLINIITGPVVISQYKPFLTSAFKTSICVRTVLATVGCSGQAFINVMTVSVSIHKAWIIAATTVRPRRVFTKYIWTATTRKSPTFIEVNITGWSNPSFWTLAEKGCNTESTIFARRITDRFTFIPNSGESSSATLKNINK